MKTKQIEKSYSCERLSFGETTSKQKVHMLVIYKFKLFNSYIKRVSR